jgi:hypothetical protein
LAQLGVLHNIVSQPKPVAVFSTDFDAKELKDYKRKQYTGHVTMLAAGAFWLITTAKL